MANQPLSMLRVHQGAGCVPWQIANMEYSASTKSPEELARRPNLFDYGEVSAWFTWAWARGAGSHSAKTPFRR